MHIHTILMAIFPGEPATATATTTTTTTNTTPF